MKSPSVLIIAGEKSGEEHGMSFLPSLQKNLQHYHFFGVGGEDFARQGVELLYHLKDFSTMGFSEVIPKFFFYLQAFRRLLRECRQRGTRHAILIDFQEFNFLLAWRLQRAQVQVFYYVAPQAWAWRGYRAPLLGSYVRTLFCLFPFEKDWFAKRGCPQVVQVTHPLRRRFKDLPLESLRANRTWPVKNLVLLPGSRSYEVASLLPIFLEVVIKLREQFDLTITLVQSPSVPAHLYEKARGVVDEWRWDRQISETLTQAHLALAASGTVTLITALHLVPTVVCYKSSLLNEWVFRHLVNYQGFVCLTNILYQAPIFPEFLQNLVSPYNVERALEKWLTDERAYEKMIAQLATTPERLSGDSVDVGALLAQEMTLREAD